MKDVGSKPRLVEGTAILRRVGWVTFPIDELSDERGMLARLGRDGWLRTFIGPGRKVRLVDGTRWRIKSGSRGPYIVPLVTSPEGTVAYSGPLHTARTYGITGREYAFQLYPMGRTGMRSTPHWSLRCDDVEVADIQAARRSIAAREPLPVSAVLLAFTLIKFGIPGESELIPRRR